VQLKDEAVIEETGVFDRLADVIIYSVAGLMALICLLPFFTIFAESFSGAEAINVGLVKLWPVDWTVDNFGWLMRDRMFMQSFGRSVLRVGIAVPLTLFMSAITAYPLSRDSLRLPGRTAYKVLLIFGMLFSGGLIPTFISYRWLGLLNTFSVLILPGAFNIFYTILLTNFFRGIPQELSESAVLDGAGHFDILFRIFLPISLPSLATVAVFAAVGHWNSWFDGVMFLRTPDLWPLQSFLYQRVTQHLIQHYMGGREIDAAREAMRFADASPKGLESAMLIIASVPVMLVYPLLQRYFVKGLTLGAIKG
jgi:putative aldouronate transport system permease protein